MKNNKKKGFTIVELVIVIAVIGILSAVLIPTFSNVTKNAKKAALDQELKGIVTTITQVEGGDLTEADYYFSYIVDTKTNEVAWYTIENGQAKKLENGENEVIVPEQKDEDDNVIVQKVILSDEIAKVAEEDVITHETEEWEDLNTKVTLYIVPNA